MIRNIIIFHDPSMTPTTPLPKIWGLRPSTPRIGAPEKHSWINCILERLVSKSIQGYKDGFMSVTVVSVDVKLALEVYIMMEGLSIRGQIVPFLPLYGEVNKLKTHTFHNRQSILDTRLVKSQLLYCQINRLE